MDSLKQFVEHLKVVLFGNSYAHLIMAVAIIFLTLVVREIFARLYNRFIRRSTDDMKTDPTNYKFLKHAISALIVVVGFSAAIWAIPSLRTLASSLLAGAGILAVAVGFASQHALSNMISGIFIVIFKPFRVNDRLTIREGLSGVVEDITLRHTVIRDWESRRVIVPNAVISDEVLVNADFGENKICKHFHFGISYGSDIKKARRIVQEEAEKHPLCLDNRTPEEKAEGAPIVAVRVLKWGDSSIDMRAWVWASDFGNAFVLSCDLYESVKERFDAEGIEIPFPHRKVVFQSEGGNTIKVIKDGAEVNPDKN